MKTTPKLCISSTLEPQGGIYRHLGNRGPGDKPWPEARRAARPYGRGNEAMAAFSRPHFGTGLVPWPPVPLVSINTPFGFQN